MTKILTAQNCLTNGSKVVVSFKGNSVESIGIDKLSLKDNMDFNLLIIIIFGKE